MKDFFTSFSTGRDGAGNLFVEFRLAIGIVLIGLASTPVIMPLGYVAAGAPLGYSWQIIGGYVFFILVDAVGAALMFWSRNHSRVGVSIDKARSVVRINDGEPKEIFIRDIDRAEFGSVPSARNPSVTQHRLEFVMRDGGRVPATAGHYPINTGDRAMLLEAVTQELSVRRAML